MYNIYLYDRQVGRLVPRGDGVQFTYNESALSDDSLPGISLSMPKREEVYGGKVAKAFFLNLLPEGAYKRLVAEAAGTSAGNDNALLGAIGGECPGAIAIWPEQQTPPDTPAYEAFGHDDFTRLFDATNPMAIASATRRARLSLAGVQEKTALFQDDGGRWFRPIDGAVTSHILKQSPATYPELLENELFCMTLAAEAGLPTASVGLPMPDIRVFCTERFDRVPPAGAVDPHHPRRKLHQEDFCQILETLPTKKYEDDGGPGLKACAGVVHDFSALAIEDIPRLLRWVGFNYIVGNEDAHAKNLAVLYEPTGLRLAPHYDLLSTEVYQNLERKSAMKIGRTADLRNVQGSDWKRVAEMLRLSWPAGRTELRQLVTQVAAALPAAMARSVASFGPAAVYQRVGALVQDRCVQLGRAVAG
jgi:serine/threonine-protein kinase HipA